MKISGHVRKGVVVLDGGATLSEGARAVVSLLSPADQEPQPETKRVELPLVSGGEPGSLDLTNERICELLDEEDIETMRRAGGVAS